MSLLKRIFFLALLLASMLALLAIGLTVGVLLLGVAALIPVYVWLVRKGFIRAPHPHHQAHFTEADSQAQPSHTNIEVIEADYEIIETTAAQPPTNPASKSD